MPDDVSRTVEDDEASPTTRAGTLVHGATSRDIDRSNDIEEGTAGYGVEEVMLGMKQLKESRVPKATPISTGTSRAMSERASTARLRRDDYRADSTCAVVPMLTRKLLAQDVADLPVHVVEAEEPLRNAQVSFSPPLPHDQESETLATPIPPVEGLSAARVVPCSVKASNLKVDLRPFSTLDVAYGDYLGCKSFSSAEECLACLDAEVSPTWSPTRLMPGLHGLGSSTEIAVELIMVVVVICSSRLTAAECQYVGFGLASVLSLLQLFTLDDAADIYKLLVADGDSGVFCTFFFGASIAIVSITMMNLVTAVLVEGALDQAHQAKDAQKEIEMERQKRLLPRLRTLFELIDDDNSGEVSWDEIKQCPIEMQE